MLQLNRMSLLGVSGTRGHDEGPGNQFAKGLGAHDWNLVKILFVPISILMSWSGHNFAHATTAKLLWHVQNCGLIGPFFTTRDLHVFYKIWIKSS